VARAKSTDRAEARRRYRASQAETAAAAAAAAAENESAEGTADASDADASGSSARSTSPASANARGSGARTAQAKPARAPVRGATSSDDPPVRPGITASFRAAIRPLDIRSDIKYAPTLILHTRAIWIPALAVIASGALAVIAPTNQITSLLAQIFVAPPSLAGPFLAGILAQRATYLAGGIVGLVAAIVLIIAVLLIPTAQFAGGDIDRGPIIAYAIVVSPLFGLAVGGFAGYYRRFLYLSNPNSRRSASQRASKPAAKRR